MEKPSKISFQYAEFDELVKVVNLKSGKKATIFEEWFNFDYSLSVEEQNFLSELIEKHKDYVASYSEEELKMYFISYIIGKTDFFQNNKRGFFDRQLKTVINGVEIGGRTDFMVATGIKNPQKPYFFIQEFKQTKHAVDIEDQLLAEMLVAIEINKATIMRGAYIVGKQWTFMILEKTESNDYLYYVSRALDSLWFNDLKQIFICLQAVKIKYCE